ncbi:MAG: hypothetical protein WDZ77_01945 [Candidatus Pacearchaeota archaeon]
MNLDKVRFGIAGGVAAFVFILFMEVVAWFTLVPIYAQMANVYGVYSAFSVLKIFFLTLVISFVVGFAVCWVFAWTYNKLLKVKVK